MEFAQFVRLLRKWGWLVLVAAIVSGGASFIIRSSRPPVYQSQAMVAIGSFIQSPNPDFSEIRTGFDLAQTYAELVTTFDVLQATARALNLEVEPEELAGVIDVRILEGTTLLVISVTYGEPTLAADIANELARQLIANSPSNLTQEQQRQINLANEQITSLNTQLESARLELQLLDERLANTTNETAIQELNGQRSRLLDQINQATQTLSSFQATITSLQQRTNSLDIVEQARVPTAPSGTNLFATTLLGTLVGIGIALGLALALEYFDDRLRSTEQVAQALGLPVLGAIVRFGKSGAAYRDRLISNLSLMISPASEGYRAVRTNLMFTSSAERNKIYLLTSPGPQEGKSLTTANLAISMAFAGQRVLLIDCDLRRPRLHEIFGLPNEVGLTTLLMSAHQRSNGTATSDEARLNECIRSTHVEKLRIITSGFIPQNPSEILGSSLMQQWMQVLIESPNFDVILLDTPPSLMLSDAIVLAASTNARVVLVIEATKTRRAAAIRVKQMFENVGIEIMGVVLNSVNTRDESYYGYGYDSYYYRPTPEVPARANGSQADAKAKAR
jgi:capsular exopolysaccharide synthesis family protein